MVVGLTVVLFVSGMLTGIWTQRSRPGEPPPLPLREFGPPGQHHVWSPEKIKEMEARMEQLRPQMEEFRRKLTALQDDYRTRIEAVLNPDQVRKLADFKEHGEDRPPVAEGRPEPALHGEMEHPPRDSYLHGMAAFIGMIVYKPQLEMLTKELELNPSQHDAVDKLLGQRREDLLKLVDANPPPSLWHPVEEGPKH